MGTWWLRLSATRTARWFGSRATSEGCQNDASFPLPSAVPTAPDPASVSTSAALDPLRSWTSARQSGSSAKSATARGATPASSVVSSTPPAQRVEQR